MEEEKVKLPKLYKIYLILLIVVVVVLIIPGSREKIFKTLNIFKDSDMELKLVGEFPIGEEISKIGIYNENIVKWGNNKLSTVDLKGIEILKKDYKFEEPDLVFGEELIYIMDRVNGKIQVLGIDGKVKKEIDLNLSFQKLKEEDGNIYIYKKDGDIETIDILNMEGELLKTHEERIPILTFNMGNKDNEYLVSTLDVDGELSTLVDLYSLDDEEIGSFSLKDEIVVYAKFIKNKIIIATDIGVYLFENSQEKWRKEIKNLKDVELVGEKLYILYDGKFEILNLRGKVKEEVDLNLPFEGIRIIGGNVLLFGKNDIIIPSSSGNRLDFRTKEDIIDLKYNNKNLLIQMRNKVEIYKMIEKGENENE